MSFLLPPTHRRARVHSPHPFTELLHLPQSILVLLNVGKSRMSACFKLDFEISYDLGRLEAQLPAGRVATMTLEVFRRWVEVQAPGPSAQLVFISANTDQQLDANATTAFFNDDVSVRVCSMDDSNIVLSVCLNTKLEAPRLKAHAPLHIHFKHPAATMHPIAPFIVDALTRRAVHTAIVSLSLPDVLVLTYDLRFPPFPPLPRTRNHT
ncbi:hypothetical protein B0H16DRAFT_1882539 [Mycena metata]|uniref:Uncharacterized protein n=1 Tax=Mycena metata TaxID=1033252 RepID=A0AAD7JME3_9AGAR|nr:hypothetical protein B0H16DRAFT_1882539 [Mycena metata]